MKNNLITLIMLNIVITTTGCGGGGNSSPNETGGTTLPTQELAEDLSPELTPELTTELTPDIPVEIILTGDLMSAPDFDFISSSDLNVTLPVSPSTNVSYFINICTDFAKENGEVNINYNSCKLRTTLSTLQQPFTLSLSPTELKLVAQIWPIEDGGQPMTIYWNIAESGSSWKIAI
jgi:hypothetical protein